MTRALLFDLDETLMVEEPAATAAFAAVAEFAATVRDIDAAQLAVGARSRARELWYAAPSIEYCLRVGISSWEGLWCRFEGDGPDSQLLRDWAPDYRRETGGLPCRTWGSPTLDSAANWGTDSARSADCGTRYSMTSTKR